MKTTNEQNVYINKADLLAALRTRKQQNIQNGVGYICGIGINQAIGIINRLPTTQIPTTKEGA